MIPALGYLRVSGLTQATEDKGGLPRQRAAIESFAAKNGYEIAAWFSDEGVSGTMELDNRPGLASCLSRAKDVKLVIVEGADRLARDSIVSELIVREFQKIEVQVIAASGGVDLTAGDNSNPTAKFVRQILAAVAEFDRCVTVLKLKAGADRKRNTCVLCGNTRKECVCLEFSGKKWGGRHRFGAKVGENSVVQKIRELHVQGISLTGIATILNENGFTTGSGKQFRAMQVSRVLKGASCESQSTN